LELIAACLSPRPTTQDAPTETPAEIETATWVLNYMLEAKDVKGVRSALHHMLEAKECETPAEPAA
jgi:hypothetical protein